MAGKKDISVTEVHPDGASKSINRSIPVEVAVAIEYGGIGYAVMMATPENLCDFAYGFSLAEGVVDKHKDILSIEPHETEKGWLLKIEVVPERQEHILTRARTRVADSSCGICGLENLDMAIRPLPKLAKSPDISKAAIFKALKSLRAHQPLNTATGGTHAAAFCGPEGEIITAREDVGRHNALDKLIGALAQQNIRAADGFFLMSSRCSYELVEKTVRAGCPALVTISTATTLAAKRAGEAGLTLICLARDDAFLRL